MAVDPPLIGLMYVSQTIQVISTKFAHDKYNTFRVIGCCNAEN